MANDDVLIVGKLDDKDLMKSINDLVDKVADKSQLMANKFESAMDKMSSAMKDFAVTQKVSVDLMKESWREMSASFDAMFEVEKRGTGGGKGSGKATYPDNTIGALEQEIALQEKKRKKMVLSSDELKQQNLLLEHQTEELKKQKSLNTWEAYRKAAKEQFGAINALSTDTIPKAQKKLRELIDLQNRYRGTKAFDEKQWNRLEAAIDNVRAKLERLKKKGATGSTGSTYDTIVDIKNLMPESSIDEVAAKMKALRQVKAQDAMETRALSDEYQRLKRRQHELMGSSVQLTKSNNYLAQSFGYIRNRIVYALTLGAVTNFIKQIYEIRGQYELLERSLGVLVNSFERGSQVFSELNKMAIESPFTLMELAGGAKQLAAYNFEAKEVVDTTRRLADISAALGVPMERLVYNLGQIRAQTRLTARDARDFANAGLPIVSALAERFSNLEGKIVTTGDVYDRMTKKMVSYNDVMAVLNEMTDEGGKFFEFQAKQAQTLRVQMANLTLAWNNMLNEIGERNQGWLTAPVKALKSMLLNWESLNRVLKNVILSYGLLKVAQVIALKNMTGMTMQMAIATVAGKALTATFIKMGAAMKALAMNPWTYLFAGLFALTDLVGQLRANIQAIHDLNSEIREDAQEAAENTNKFLTNKGNVSTRKLAQDNKLTAEEGEKAWEQIRQQIEQSALSSNNLIGKLLEIENINERVRTGFDYTEAINKAAYALSQLDNYDITISRDKGWWGMLGEGMVSDLKDYADEVKAFEGDYMEFLKIINTSYGDNNPLKINYKEFQKELEFTANDIKDFIDRYNITDPLQINEILERVRAKIKEKNPEIKGEAARLFDIELDKQMSKLTKGAVDENASLWAMFMERLKHNSSSTFQGITDDWVKNSDKLSKEQQDAVDENLEYFKKSMPYAYDAVAKMVADASKLKIQIGIAFNVQALSDFQKQVKDRIKENEGVLDFGNESMWGTAQDNLETWVDARQKAIKALRAENKLYEKDDSDWAKEKIKNNNAEIEQNKNLLDLFHQSYEAEKKTKGGSKKKDILGEALSKEVELIDNIQKRYKEYQKMGVDSQTAITKATEEYGITLKNVGDVLSKYGIKTKTSQELASMDLRGVRDYLQNLLDYAKALGNTKGIEAIEKSLAKINVEITKIDYKRITDGLNNELSKLKDEYELAIELDANPELGGVFAEMMGLSEEQLKDLPRNYEAVLTKLQGIIDSKLGSGRFDLAKNLSKAALDEWLKTNQQGTEQDDAIAKTLNTFRKYANKVRLDETKKQLENWDKLLEKYAEYEYKKEQIRKQYESERETALKKNADQNILDAITKRFNQENARLDFEQFQKTPEWITATGDLAGMTHKAISSLIKDLEDYKEKAKNLDPKQIKQLNKALESLYKQQRKMNPFHAIADAEAQAIARAKEYQPEIDGLEKQLRDLENNRSQENIAEEAAEIEKLTKKIKELKEKQAEAGELDVNTVIEGLNAEIAIAQKAISVFTDLADAIGGNAMTNASQFIKDFSDIIGKVGSGAATGAAIGGGWGAAIGGILGGISAIASKISDIWTENGYINDRIKESEIRVKKLELAYTDLEHAINNTYSNEAYWLRRVAIENKKAQLSELNRQLTLEQSRKSKNQDEDKIIELRKQIKELEYDIKDSVDSLVNDLLGISSVGDAAEEFMNDFVNALRNGEKAMKTFKESINDLIANMVVKMYTTKILIPWLESVWNTVQEQINERAGTEVPHWIDYWQRALDDVKSGGNYKYWGYWGENQTKDEWITQVEGILAKLQKELQDSTAITTDDIKQYAELLREGQPIMQENMAEIQNLLKELGLMKSTSLSALQAGIQGITEDTAGALEAYMNGMSQQVYAQTEYLRQIADVMTRDDNPNDDIQIASLSQILLQLQNSYQEMMTMRTMMENWTVAAGNGIRVELMN